MKKVKFNFVIISPGRSGTEHLKETLNYFEDIKVLDELFNRANFESDSFNAFLKRNIFYRTLAICFNRQSLSSYNLNFPLQYLIKKFLHEKGLINKVQYGFKLTLDQLKAYPMVLKLLLNSGVKLIYLYREDRLAQVLSLLKARKTGIYHQIERDEISTAVEFDINVVKAIYNFCQREENKLLARLINVEKVILSYEDLFNNYSEQVDTIRRFLDLPKSEIVNYSDLIKQNSNKLESWVSNLDDIKKELQI